jgi:hypothetical protein
MPIVIPKNLIITKKDYSRYDDKLSKYLYTNSQEVCKMHTDYVKQHKKESMKEYLESEKIPE